MSARRWHRCAAFGAKLSVMPALATLLIAPVAAQESSSNVGARSESGASQVLEEVVVRGSRLGEIEFDLSIYISNFVKEVAAPARARGYARWRRSVCIGVHNLENNAAQYIADRISSLAVDVGLNPGEPGCGPDVNILFAVDAREMAAYMVEHQPRVFRPAGGNAGMDRGLEALDDFVQAERAVRWWHVSRPVDARTGQTAIRMPGEPPPVIAVAGASRVHSGIRDDLQYVIIIVDATELTGKTWQQIADYLAVVSLAQIDPKANLEDFDTILNLFTNPAAYSGLTDWDRSYVEALYAFDQERMPSLQRSEIVSRIAKREREAAE